MVDLDELKTQLTEFDALESKGYKPVSLDDLDLWQFEKYEMSQDASIPER